MTPEQQLWLEGIAAKVPKLFAAISEGNYNATFIVGTRTINGKLVRLQLVARVVDSGTNPLQSHASVNMPQQSSEVQDSMPTPKPRNRKRAKRW